MDEQARKAARFLELHHADEILVLLNAWDVASARLFARAGCAAVGTTSMGIAAAHGHPDVEVIPLELMLRSVAAIAAAVDVPVTADMEAGYGSTTEEVVASIARAVDAGAVGINIEDGTGRRDDPLLEPRVLAERISAIREATSSRGLHLVVNARTDPFLARIGATSACLRAAIERGTLYAEAGADCVFVPGGLGRDTIAELVRELPAPLNVVANPALSVPVVPPVPELQELGVARVSVGSGLMRSTLAFARRAAEEILCEGTYGAMATELAAPGAREAYETAIGRL